MDLSSAILRKHESGWHIFSSGSTGSWLQMIPKPMELMIAEYFIFPLSVLWIQSREDDTNEDEMDFL